MPRIVSIRRPPDRQDLLTGKKLTQEEIAALEAKKKEREARCKPQADRLAQLQKEILAAQQ